MKSYQYSNFDILEYMIQLDGYFYVNVSGQRKTALEKNNSSSSPGTMVHVMHVLFVFYAVFSLPEPKAWSDGDMVRRPSVVRSHFQRSSPLKPLGQSKPNFMWSLLG